MLLRADGTIDVLPNRVGLPLGVDPSRPRPEHRSVLPVNSTLLLYTDGLLEQFDVPAAATGRSGGSGTRDLDTGLARLTDPLALRTSATGS